MYSKGRETDLKIVKIKNQGEDSKGTSPLSVTSAAAVAK